VSDREHKDTVSRLIQDSIARRVSRREVLRRGAALGVAAPMVAAMITVSEAAPVFAQDAAEIVLGCPYNLTGAYQSIDVPAKDGSLLAAKLLNANGGVLGKQLKLIVENGNSDLTTITNICKKMADEDKVIAFVGLTDTDYMRAGGQIAQERSLPFLDVGGTAPLITQIGDYIYMLPFGDNVQAAAGAEFAHEKGWKTCAMLVDDAMSYTKFLAQYFKERYTMDDIGGEVVKELSYQIGDTDYSSQITEFQGLDPQPDLLFVSSNPAEIGTIVKQVREAGMETPILGGDGYDTPQLLELAGDNARNVFFTTHQGIYGDAPESKAFSEAYDKEYGKAPDSVFAALGFDGINLMADAITRAGDTNGEKIRDSLGLTSGFKGATGDISYKDGSHIPDKSVALIEVKDGKFNLIKIVVPTTVPKA
jgi:branched-chain amino acid transport system substrate-binding protein